MICDTSLYKYKLIFIFYFLKSFSTWMPVKNQKQTVFGLGTLISLFSPPAGVKHNSCVSSLMLPDVKCITLLTALYDHLAKIKFTTYAWGSTVCTIVHNSVHLFVSLDKMCLFVSSSPLTASSNRIIERLFSGAVTR